LRKFAGLTKNVVLVGQGAKFELWDGEQWDLQMDDALDFKDGDMPTELEGFSL
jgi:MraZ protein